MPEQEIFLDEWAGGRHITVLKTYDDRFAREVLSHMDAHALAALRQVLEESSATHDNTASAETPDVCDNAEALWENLRDAAREDWNLFSYFVVQSSGDSISHSIYVSPDWPSAESYAKKALAGATMD